MKFLETAKWFLLNLVTPTTDEHTLTLHFGGMTFDRLKLVKNRIKDPDTVSLVRKSLAFYDLGTEHVAEGGQIIFRNKDGKDEVIRLMDPEPSPEKPQS